MVKSDSREKELRAIDAVLDRDNEALDRLVTDPDENARIFLVLQGQKALKTSHSKAKRMPTVKRALTS